MMAYGYVTPGRWKVLATQGEYLHVYYKGEDVTTRCAFVDDTGEGMAELYLLNADGKKYVRPIFSGEYGAALSEMEVAKEIVYGVEIRAGAPLV